MEEISSSPSEYYHYLILNDEENIHVPAFRRRLQAREYILFRITFHPLTGLETELMCHYPRYQFLESPLDMITSMLNSSQVPSELVDSYARPIATYISDYVAHNHDFSASSLLPIHVCITYADIANEVASQDELERAMSESADAFQTLPATKSSIEALELVEDFGIISLSGDADECRCMICLEELSNLYLSLRELYSDNGSNNDGDEDRHQKVLRMPCSHLYHKDCIVRWLETSHLCPLCRYAMPTN